MKFFTFCSITVVLLAAGLVFPMAVHSHGVEIYDITDTAPESVRTVHFKYSTGEPMMYARVKVYPPSKPELDILQSITDRNGVFSFVPDEAGEWRLDVEDGMGHKGTITIIVEGGEVSGEKAAAAGGSGGKLSQPLGIALGLSVMVNIFAVWYFLGKRKKGGADS